MSTPRETFLVVALTVRPGAVSLFIILNDDCVESMKKQEPAVVSYPDISTNFREFSLSTITVGYLTETNREDFKRLANSGEINQALLLIDKWAGPRPPRFSIN